MNFTKHGQEYDCTMLYEEYVFRMDLSDAEAPFSVSGPNTPPAEPPETDGHCGSDKKYTHNRGRDSDRKTSTQKVRGG